jgi:hypothetical protein
MKGLTLFRARSALLALAALALVAGCGGASYEEITAPPPTIAAAAKRTATTGSFKSTLTGTYSVPGYGTVLKLKGKGRYDTKARRAAFTIRLSGKAVEHCTCDQKRMDFVFEGGKGFVAYVRWGLLANEMPAGKEWVRVDMLQALRIKRAEWEQMQRLTMSDPSQILDQLLAADRVHEVGFDRIRGRFVTRYEVHVNLRKLDTRGSKERAALAKTFKRMAKAFGYGSFDADVWVDDTNRVRRVSLEVEIEEEKGEPPVTMTVTEEFHGFGKPVEIRRPPARLTWDLFRAAV